MPFSEKFMKEKRKLLAKEKQIPKEVLIDLYVLRKLPVYHIVTELDTTESLLYKNLDFHGIPRRGLVIENHPGARYAALRKKFKSLRLDEDRQSTTK